MTTVTTVAEAGERELIRLLEPFLTCGSGEGCTLGVGDDCAVLKEQPSGARTVVTTDLLVEGVHFLSHDATNWEWVGRKAAGANISDIAAMGAKPVAMFVSIALPLYFPVKHVLDLYRGLFYISSQISLPIMGGDTTRGDRICISITVTGVKERDRAECRRTDARPGDYLYISGNLGSSRAGLDLMLRPELQMLISQHSAAYLIERHFTMEPRTDLGSALARLYPRVCMIDISDSLYNEASLIAEASDVEVKVHLDTVPVDENARLLCEATSADAARYALFSGEEYELLVAAPIAPADLFEDLRQNGVECAVTLVGTVNSGRGLRLLQDGHPVDPKDETFVHFP